MTESKAEPWGPLTIGGETVAPGEQARFDLPVALLPTHTQLHIPLTILNGRRAGPRLWVSAAVHGDELNGVEIIARVLDRIGGKLQRGALIAAPIVNVFGFINGSRYLPDRRDLNRSFPGSSRGSVASRMAHIFLTEIVDHCTHGIDLHTAGTDRTNYPQTRGDLHDEETRRFALAFGAPLMVHSSLRDGSLRAAARERGIRVLVYEGGQPLRFDEDAIQVGVRGVLGVMRELGMTGRRRRVAPQPPTLIESSTWVRAKTGGILRLSAKGGQFVAKNQVLGLVSGPFGDEEAIVRAPFDGIVIGFTQNPVVHGGDAVVHLGRAGPLEAEDV